MPNLACQVIPAVFVFAVKQNKLERAIFLSTSFNGTRSWERFSLSGHKYSRYFSCIDYVDYSSNDQDS